MNFLRGHIAYDLKLSVEREGNIEKLDDFEHLVIVNPSAGLATQKSVPSILERREAALALLMRVIQFYKLISSHF